MINKQGLSVVAAEMSSGRIIARAELKKRTSPNELWIAIDGLVYDVRTPSALASYRHLVSAAYRIQLGR